MKHRTLLLITALAVMAAITAPTKPTPITTTNQPKPLRSTSGGTRPVRRLPTRLPSTAPGMLPIPPRTAATKALIPAIKPI